MNESYKRFIREVKRIMYARGVSVRRTAEALGISHMSLSHYLNLRHIMRADIMLTCAEHFGISLDKIRKEQ